MSMGFGHMADLKGYDHMLFVVVLCAAYKVSDWKKVLILVTAFTIGHSVTLALSALRIILPDRALIELLIPVTILCTSLSYILRSDEGSRMQMISSYVMALLFGFIHGMGFSSFFNALMGDSMDITLPLFAFNLGLEAGQIIIVLLFFALYFMISKFRDIEARSWKLFFSGIGTGVSVIMILERI